MLNDKLYVLWWRMCNPYDIANYGVSRQPPDHTAQTRSHGTNQVTRDKSGTKRDLQAPHGGPGYGVTVHILIFWQCVNTKYICITNLEALEMVLYAAFAQMDNIIWPFGIETAI